MKQANVSSTDQRGPCSDYPPQRLNLVAQAVAKTIRALKKLVGVARFPQHGT
jgi:hypothetical protein